MLVLPGQARRAETNASRYAKRITAAQDTLGADGCRDIIISPIAALLMCKRLSECSTRCMQVSVLSQKLVLPRSSLAAWCVQCVVYPWKALEKLQWLELHDLYKDAQRESSQPANAEGCRGVRIYAPPCTKCSTLRGMSCGIPTLYARTKPKP